MKKIEITDRLLGLFLSGDTTPEETYVIFKAARTNPNVALFLEVAEKGGYLSLVPESNQSAMPASKRYYLHSLPLMRLAASGKANDCVVKCEEYVLKLFSKESQHKSLYNEARHREWLHAEGTPLYNIGRLSELASLSVSRRFRGTIDEIRKELQSGCSVIVVINVESLSGSKSRKAAICNHAVVLINIDEEKKNVELYDPQSANPSDQYSISSFLRAWKPSKNFFVSIIERGVRPYTPHPEYVAHIKLPKEIEPLADMLAENAHEIWAKDRLAEAEKKKAKGKDVNPFDDPFMKPFHELSKQKRRTDYLSALNTIKLLYKLGFKITQNPNSSVEYKPNIRTADGQYVPNPIIVDDVVLPKEIEELTEYIAENAHEEWAKQRIKEGWTFAPQTNKKLKQSFDLVPYCELLDSEKEYDRRMAMNTLRVLYKYGYKIEKQDE